MKGTGLSEEDTDVVFILQWYNVFMNYTFTIGTTMTAQMAFLLYTSVYASDLVRTMYRWVSSPA